MTIPMPRYRKDAVTTEVSALGRHEVCLSEVKVGSALGGGEA